MNDEEQKTINVYDPIQSFVVSVKDDIVCVLLSNKQLELYRLASANEIDSRSRQFQYYAHQVAFIHLGALWLGNVFTAKQFAFHIQQFNDCSHSECSIKLKLKSHSADQSILAEWLNKDQLVCAFESNLLVRFQLLDSMEISLIEQHTVAGPVSHIASNEDNSLVLFITNGNTVNLIHSGKIITYGLDNPNPIKSICFDSRHKTLFFVSTDSLTHCFTYLLAKQQFVLCDSIQNSSQASLLMAKLPRVYFTAEGKIIVRQFEELLDFLDPKQTTLGLLSMDYKKFVENLYCLEFEKQQIWLTFAKRCFRENDIQTAIFCVSKSGNASLVRSLKREYEQYGDVATSPLLALNLGLVDEAESMYRGSGQVGHLCQLYQLQNKWDKAFESADKIKLKSLYYEYAKQLESESKVVEAMKYYEMSNNVMEIPRMLFEVGNVKDLKEYCLKDGKSALVSWWGQYCESQDENGDAIEMYRRADDYYNLVRLLCHIGKVDTAIQMLNDAQESSGGGGGDGGDGRDMTAAFLYLGKHLESVNSAESINYYLQCKAIRHAIRVCVANELWDELIGIAVDDCSEEVAQNILVNYFESEDRLVSRENMAKLYYKCGKVAEAISNAIHYQLWDELRVICHRELTQEDRKCVVRDEEIDLILDHLRHNSEIIDIVIDVVILASPGNFDRVTDIIRHYGINLNEAIIEKLEHFMANQKDPALISTFAELCLEKGNYQLAAKLYNKIGKRVESVKALIRSGNVDKVIQFANVARDKQVFKMAANFLQTIGHQDDSLIIKFYRKAEAHQELERFQNAHSGQSG